jgi:hypothetical protein
MPDDSLQSAPASAEKKHKLTPAMEAKIIKPGEVRNPLGRPPGVKSVRSKLLSKYSQLWGRADAPDDWIGDSLKLMKKQGLTIDELIVIRVKYCLATNTKYQNPALLKEMMDRAENTGRSSRNCGNIWQSSAANRRNRFDANLHTPKT